MIYSLKRFSISTSLNGLLVMRDILIQHLISISSFILIAGQTGTSCLLSLLFMAILTSDKSQPVHISGWLNSSTQQDLVSPKQPFDPLSGRPLDKCLCKGPFLKAIETRRKTAVWLCGIKPERELPNIFSIVSSGESLKLYATVLLVQIVLAT